MATSFIEKRRPMWQWCLLLLIFLAVLIVGFLSILLCQNFPFAVLFAITGFSIAFAIHYFGVSTGLNTIYIRTEDPETRYQLRKIEYDIVTSGMLVLSGGLFILLAGGFGMLLVESLRISHVPTLIFTLFFYIIGALLLLFGVARYVFCQRGWPRKAQEIIEKKSQNLLCERE